MSRLRLRKPAPATAISIVALIVALGGTSYAAFGPFKGDKIIKKHSLSANRLKKLNQLGKVPSATRADTAGFASNAGALGGVPPSAYAAAAQSPFIAPTLNAGYSNYGSGWSKAGYMKDSVGFVHLSGTLNCPTSPTGAAYTLPAGYRPSTNQSLSGIDDVNSGIAVYVHTDGQVFSSSNTFGLCGFDGIIFPAAGVAGTRPVSQQHYPTPGPRH